MLYLHQNQICSALTQQQFENVGHFELRTLLLKTKVKMCISEKVFDVINFWDLPYALLLNYFVYFSLNLAIHYLQHCQIMLWCGLCELAHFCFHFFTKYNSNSFWLKTIYKIFMVDLIDIQFTLLLANGQLGGAKTSWLVRMITSPKCHQINK